MKRFIMFGIALSFAFILGCSTVSVQETEKQGALFQDWHHAWFSIKNTLSSEPDVTATDIERSQKDGWYGEDVEIKK